MIYPKHIMPLSKMSLDSMGGLFHCVAFPSATYGIRPFSHVIIDEPFEYLTVVRAGLLKMWCQSRCREI